MICTEEGLGDGRSGMGVPASPSGLRPCGAEPAAAIAFTPGPWKVTDSSYDRGPGDSGPRWDVHVPGKETIADVHAEANARLIAASPDMYAALKQIVLAFKLAHEAQNLDWRESASISAAEAALAKAGGEA